MSGQRRESEAAPRGEAHHTRARLFRVLEGLLWLGVAGLFVARVAPQVRAAVGWKSPAMGAPAVTFDLLDGGALPLGALKGRVVLVNFWATWCPPCRAEMPGLEKVYADKRAAGFTVVGISMDQSPRQQVASFLHDHAIEYPVAMATVEAVAAFGGVNDLPTSFLIDRKGRVRYTVRGMFAGVTLRAAVDRLLAEHG